MTTAAASPRLSFSITMLSLVSRLVGSAAGGQADDRRAKRTGLEQRGGMGRRSSWCSDGGESDGIAAGD